MNKHRKIWVSIHGDIPVDELGRPYEIHHIDGDHQNDDPTNLKCIPIQEHFEIHFDQGDFGAAALIAKRMRDPGLASRCQTGVKRPGIGGRKKGGVPWNKGKTGYWSPSRKLRSGSSLRNRGVGNGRSRLTEEIVLEIRQNYADKISLENYVPGIKPGKGRKGLCPTYDGAFEETYAQLYGVTPENIRRITQRLSWKHVQAQ